MSIATEITRLQTAKADLKTAIEGKGVTVPASALISDYADLVESISGGGGSQKYDDLVAAINGNFTGETFENSDITIVLNKMLSGGRLTANTKRISLPNCETLSESAFYQANSVKSFYLPKVKSVGSTALGYCNNSEFTVFVLPSVEIISAQALRNMAIHTLDVLGGTTSSAWGGSALIATSALNTLIIRQTSAVSPISNINVFSNTPFASNGSGGTLYVPSALISAYESATNWATILGYANNSVAAIEGSAYETQYADGTPIA